MLQILLICCTNASQVQYKICTKYWKNYLCAFSLKAVCMLNNKERNSAPKNRGACFNRFHSSAFTLQIEMKGCTGKHSIGERENKQKERIIHISKMI